jgi:hypothetical protein
VVHYVAHGLTGLAKVMSMTRTTRVHETLSLVFVSLLTNCGGSSARGPRANDPDASAPPADTGGSLESKPDAAPSATGSGGSLDGGDASVDASVRDDGGADAGPTGGSGPVTPAMPAECQVPGNSGTPAGSITFELDNRSSGPIYVDQCAQVPRVYSCADGYTEPVEYLPAFSTISCVTGEGYCGGGGCENFALAREVGVTDLVTWNAVVYAYELAPPPRACTCYRESPAPSGKYRATLKIYGGVESLSVIDSETEGKLLSVDFVVPDDDGVVTFEYSG